VASPSGMPARNVVHGTHPVLSQVVDDSCCRERVLRHQKLTRNLRCTLRGPSGHGLVRQLTNCTLHGLQLPSCVPRWPQPLPTPRFRQLIVPSGCVHERERETRTRTHTCAHTPQLTSSSSRPRTDIKPPILHSVVLCVRFRVLGVRAW
jgi:hypothetical protein